METDIGTVDPSRIDFQGLRSESFHRELEDIEPIRQESHVHPEHQEPQQGRDHMQYYPPPQVYQQTDKRDVFADMDRSTYIFIFISFVIGFFVGRGMIQPVIIKGH